jgi:phage terminase large subunit-like protein
MSVLMTPPFDEDAWPTLGPQVCSFIEDYLVFGPGDLRGEPAKLDAEKRAIIYRLYEVYPQHHPQAGRRRFKRGALSVRKGWAKTELAAWLAAVELHPDGPVRCDGFDANGNPVGRGVVDPYIPMVAYTEEQSDELAYGALRVILQYSHLADDFDIGIERIMRIGGDGKAVSLSAAPGSRDGARTTFQLFDETHRMNMTRLINAHKTMLANIPKRKMSDAWTLEITTAPKPGEGSIAENTMDYAQKVIDGAVQDSRLFFFHRQAADTHDLSTPEGIRAAVTEASGPVAVWSDIDSIVEQWNDPTADKSFLERVWLNRRVRSSEQAFDMTAWEKCADPEYLPVPGSKIALGFDGARWHDSTALVGTEIITGFQFLLGVWEKTDENDEGWEVPIQEVRDAVENAFATWDVWRFYCDPPYWETAVSEWAGQYGEKRVVEWWTNRRRAMSHAILAFANAISSGDILHDGNKRLSAHVANAVRADIPMRDEDGKPMWVIYKERPNSPRKIDAAMAAILSWQARTDALTLGVGKRESSVYERRGLVLA